MYWTREIAGWILVGFSLILIRIGLTFVVDLDESPRIVEAGVLMFAAMGLLRAGILLIRMSTAARICQSNRGDDHAGK